MNSENNNTQEKKESLFDSVKYKLRYISLIQHLENQALEKVDTNPKEAVELLRDANFMLKEYILKEEVFTEDELLEAIRQCPKNVKFEINPLTKKILKQEAIIDVIDSGSEEKVSLNFTLLQHTTTRKDECDEV